MRNFIESLKTLARSTAVAGMIATAGAAGAALSITPAAAQVHGGGGGFHGGGFGGGGFHGGGFHGGTGAFRAGDGGFRGGMRGDRDDFRGGFHRGEWRGGRWYGPGWVGWYGADGYLYDDPYGCGYYDYYYGYCAY